MGHKNMRLSHFAITPGHQEAARTKSAFRGYRHQSALRSYALGAGVILGVLAPSLAFASDSFPVPLQEAAGLDCVTTCEACHSTQPGTAGTAGRDSNGNPKGTEFGAAMEDHGLLAGDTETVALAYDSLTEAQNAPDNDPSDDVDLTLEDAPCSAEVVYGCGAHIVPQPARPEWPWALLAGLSTFVIGFRRFFAKKA